MEWRPLDLEEAKRLWGRQVLIAKADKKCHAGVIKYLSPGFLELENGKGHRQHVSFSAHRWFVVEITPVPKLVPKMGQPRFDWSSK